MKCGDFLLEQKAVGEPRQFKVVFVNKIIVLVLVKKHVVSYIVLMIHTCVFVIELHVV